MAGCSRGVGATMTGCCCTESTDGGAGVDISGNEVWMLGTADGEVSSVGFAPPRVAIVDTAKIITTADVATIDPWTHRVRRLTGAVGEAILVPPGIRTAMSDTNRSYSATHR